MYHNNKLPFWVVVLLVVTILVSGCGSSATPSLSVPNSEASASLATEEIKAPTSTEVPTLSPTKTKAPTPTKAPTKTTAPTATAKPSPTFAQPVTMLEFNGTGAMITDDYQLPACWKSLLYWHVDANNYGSASLILTGYNKDTGEDKTLVNEFGMDMGSDGLNGIAFCPLLGGTYYFQTENTDESWTAKLECQDNIAPVGEGMDVQGTGGFVSDDYTLHTCNKSIFNWSVQPSNSGSASLILSLCKANEDNNCETIVNEFQMDMSSPMTGQALQKVVDGDYFLVSENTQEAWTVTWECKD